MSENENREFENLIYDSYYKTTAGPLLPSLLQLIYQEGIRANHLLFSSEDLAYFSSLKTPLQKEIPADEAHDLESTFCLIFSSSDLRTMQNLIAEKSQKMRHQIFMIYQNFLFSWAMFLRRSLN